MSGHAPPIRVAVNYSETAAGLVRQGAIAIDLFKCPDWPDVIPRARALAPVYVHFPMVAGSADFGATDWMRVEALAGETATPFINVHLAPRASDFPDIPTDCPLPDHAEEVRRRLTQDVTEAVRRFGAGRVLAENVPYRKDPEGFMRAAVDPDVITHIVEATGCGLLLDLAHARLAAPWFGPDERAYLTPLPLQRVRELHVTGVVYHEGRLRDHMPMADDDWTLLAWALEEVAEGRCGRPWALVFEYGGIGPAFEWRSRADVLAAQLPRLRNLINDSEAPSTPSRRKGGTTRKAPGSGDRRRTGII